MPAASTGLISRRPRPSSVPSDALLVALGGPAHDLRLNCRSRRRRALEGRHHRRLFREARGNLDATVIGKTSLDGEACNPIVSDVVSTKLPSPSEPTAVAGTVSASGRRFISRETSAYMPG